MKKPRVALCCLLVFYFEILRACLQNHLFFIQTDNGHNFFPENGEVTKKNLLLFKIGLNICE
ncbi:MAG: hypothetical protein ACK5MZ_05200 [Aestuariibaculum sp.]